MLVCMMCLVFSSFGGETTKSARRHMSSILRTPFDREGERPREPKSIRVLAKIRAREDARPPIKGLGYTPYFGAQIRNSPLQCNRASR